MMVYCKHYLTLKTSFKNKILRYRIKTTSLCCFFLKKKKMPPEEQ